jgi:hypothetical protein
MYVNGESKLYPQWEHIIDVYDSWSHVYLEAPYTFDDDMTLMGQISEGIYGGAKGQPHNFLVGRVASVGVWGVALSPSDVAMISNGGLREYKFSWRDSGLLAYFTMEEAFDNSGRALTLDSSANAFIICASKIMLDSQFNSVHLLEKERILPQCDLLIVF